MSAARDRTVASAPLAFTGERFTPECSREIWYEHWHRYQFASPWTAGRRVLDAACGEGYGSALLARTAASVIGVDVDAAAVAHARERYGAQANLRFERGDATTLAFAPASFDVVVSFETLEHVAAQEALVAGFARVLADDGLLVVSSPDKRTYSDETGYRNEYHVRELYRDELLALLRPHFAHVRLFGQKLLFQSAIWDESAGSGPYSAATAAQGDVENGMRYDPLYFIALCSRRPLPDALPALSLFGDREESVYRHYNGEVRRNMAAGARIAELEAQLAAASATHSSRVAATPAPSWWRRWFGRRTA